MAYHAYIDESGTMEDQIIMTVAMVVLEGARSGQRLHRRAAEKLFPIPKIRAKSQREEWFAKVALHYADMKHSEKLMTAEVFGRSALKMFVAHHAHDERTKDHAFKFSIYRNLVCQVLSASFNHYDDLEISVAKQGGWQDYERDFINELRALSEHLPGHKTKIRLSSAAKHGIQIADFYAGVSRDYLLADSPATSTSHYELVRHQIDYTAVLQAVVLVKKEG
jgi:hypothetical protein